MQPIINDVSMNDVFEWYKIQKQLADLKAKEMELRTKIAKGLFPSPIEGTNKHPLEGGFNLTLTHKIDRKIDEASLGTLTRTLHENGVPVDELVNYKPSLVLAAYRKLEGEHLKLFDNVLIIKPATPSLAIVEGKVK